MTTNTENIEINTEKDLNKTVNTVADQLQSIETFIARRFDELSMEINATAQQVDLAEEGIVQRFSDVLEVIAAISHRGDGSSPANAGVELDAVVDMTEAAANTILDASGAIGECIGNDEAWSDPQKTTVSRQKIQSHIDEIFMSCSFQDITGQRIKKTLENLHEIEDRLSSALDKLGIHIEVKAEDHEALSSETAANQDDIDELFGSG